MGLANSNRRKGKISAKYINSKIALTLSVMPLSPFFSINFIEVFWIEIAYSLKRKIDRARTNISTKDFFEWNPKFGPKDSLLKVSLKFYL